MEKLKVVGQIVEIPLDKIRPNPNQRRKEFDLVKLHQLAMSIKAEKQQVPAEVRNVGGGVYELIKGERRWRACKIAGVPCILCIVKEGVSDKAAVRCSTIDNIGRENHTPLEMMQIFADDLLEKKNDPERPREMKTKEIMIQEIADSYSQSTATVYNHLRLLNLPPEIRNLLKEKKITLSTALAIEKCSDKLKQSEMAEKAVKDKLTAKQVEYELRTAAEKSGKQYGKRKRKPSDDRDVFEGFVRRTLHHSTRYFDAFHSNGTVARMFKTGGDRKQVRKDCLRCSELFKEMAESI